VRTLRVAVALAALAAFPALAEEPATPAPDPTVAALVADWTATRTAQGHAEAAIQHLVDAYVAEKEKASKALNRVSELEKLCGDPCKPQAGR
jgi:multidrug efflux pump subunit AcrA (membrane-fusion protein)